MDTDNFFVLDLCASVSIRGLFLFRNLLEPDSELVGQLGKLRGGC